LITNDDGIYSPGLLALAEVAAHFGQVRVVAPDVEQSAMGHAITIQRPLRYHRAQLGPFEAYRVNGTPADCVALGLYRWDGADLVLSGINLGSNLGHEIWHSGTVGAARQAALLGVRAAAFSLRLDGETADFTAVRPAFEQVLQLLIELPGRYLINVNSPLAPHGWRWTRQSVRAYSGQIVEGAGPDGHKHYWFAESPLAPPEEGTDRWAVDYGFVALTPLRLDLTDVNWQEEAQRQHPAEGPSLRLPVSRELEEAS
jgi:5'-nucleotidase